jgi:PatG Domain
MTEDSSTQNITESNHLPIPTLNEPNNGNIENTDIPEEEPSPQNTMQKPCGCGGGGRLNNNVSTTPSYIYAIGRIQPRFPNPSVEKEFVQATARSETKGLADTEALSSVLSQKQNRYLVRQICWVLNIEGLETYILVPRDPSDYDLLVEALRPTPRVTDVDVIIGLRGSMASPQMCNGLVVPVVMFDQIYSFDTCKTI